ncbi:dihydropteroate synthase-like protein [Fervidicoccus fontis]|uniref:Dihydropteroate synthase-related protein n=2 Tax=Fervidicoccus fontis TaxID=683846 RepID=I0A1W1_FERFK|nr:dihydropteroate synthase-like protein [Fervidicoccus fontis]AFH42968.1 dihydropteroate synthase-related protein [Fervidicoccus fontis Kam940]MBE9391476.1 dihydropteroate synthase-like protein [Fervidicoccus fontis]
MLKSQNSLKKERKMKIGIITGKRAYDLVKQKIDNSFFGESITIKIFKLEIEVAAMLTTSIILEMLKKDEVLVNELREMDVILIPGTVSGSTEEISILIGKPVYKASRDLSLLKELINFVSSGKKLSSTISADEILNLDRLKRFEETLEEIYKNKYPVAFEIKNIKIPVRGPPIFIASETPTGVSPQDVGEYVRYLEDSGADIINVAIPIGESFEDSIKRIKNVAESIRKSVLGIDTINTKLMLEAYDYGAEVYFSLDSKNIEELKRIKEKSFVVIPSEKTLDMGRENIVLELENTIKKAEELGFRKLIVDPIIKPPCTGFVDSLILLHDVSERVKNYPFMLSFSNVIELMDADSVGINAILSTIAAEMGASLILVSEESWKARGSTLEARISSLMSSYAFKNKTPPINIGTDLLLFKSKKKPVSMKPPEEFKKIVTVENQGEPIMDKGIYVLIFVDHEKRLIYLCVHGEEKLCYASDNGKDLYKKLTRSGVKFSNEHASYIGYELAKAEFSLKLGKQYEQDFSSFVEPKEKYFDILKYYKNLVRDIE